MKLTIPFFNPSVLTPHNVFLIAGKRNTGKSLLMRDILYHIKDKYSAGVVISPTDSATGFWSRHIPKSFIYSEFTEETVARVIESQKALARRNQTPASIFLVLDDCMHNNKILKSKPMRDVLLNGRHYKIGLFISTQYVTLIDTAARANVDYTFSLAEKNYENIQKLYKYFFASSFTDFKRFLAAFNSCTLNFECMVQDNTAVPQSETGVLYYKANPERTMNFLLGEFTMWPFEKDKQRRKRKNRKMLKTFDM